MRSPKEVRDLIMRRYQSKHRQWLTDIENGENWPLTFTLDPPSEKEIISNTALLHQWIKAWREWKDPIQVVWEERKWNKLGTQSLPIRIEIGSSREVAATIGSEELIRWERAVNRRDFLIQRWPTIHHELGRHFPVLADLHDDDFDRLVRVVQWLIDNPQSGLYVRQIPVEGLDTKWIESRRQIVQQWLCAIRGDELNGKTFFQVCGLRSPPDIARIMLLDASLRAQCLGLRDISAPIEELAKANLNPKIVLIVENKTTGQALPDIPGAVAIVGRGYAIELLGQFSWMQRAKCYYWGDIDTHGFAILHRARHYVPTLCSMMMDEQTLQEHLTLCVSEEKQLVNDSLDLLTPEEQLLYTRLKTHAKHEPNRLEQERLNWSYVLCRLSSAFSD